MAERIFEIHPKRPISGILPNNKRISEVMRLPLSRAEFLRCMSNATVYAVVGEERVIVTNRNYEDAIALFDKHVEFTQKKVILHDGNIVNKTAVTINDKKVEISTLPKHPVPTYKQPEAAVTLLKDKKENEELSSTIECNVGGTKEQPKKEEDQKQEPAKQKVQVVSAKNKNK